MILLHSPLETGKKHKFILIENALQMVLKLYLLLRRLIRFTGNKNRLLIFPNLLA